MAETAFVAALVVVAASSLALRVGRKSMPTTGPEAADPPLPAARAVRPRWYQRLRVRRVVLVLTVPVIAGLAMWVGVETALQPNLLDNPVIVYGAAAYLTLKALDELVSGLVGTSEFDQAWEAMSKFLRLGLAIAAIGYGVGNDDTHERLVTLGVSVLTLIGVATGVMYLRRWQARSALRSASVAQASGTRDSDSIAA